MNGELRGRTLFLGIHPLAGLCMQIQISSVKHNPSMIGDVFRVACNETGDKRDKKAVPQTSHEFEFIVLVVVEFLFVERNFNFCSFLLSSFQVRTDDLMIEESEVDYVSRTYYYSLSTPNPYIFEFNRVRFSTVVWKLRVGHHHRQEEFYHENKCGNKWYKNRTTNPCGKHVAC